MNKSNENYTKCYFFYNFLLDDSFMQVHRAWHPLEFSQAILILLSFYRDCERTNNDRNESFSFIYKINFNKGK